MATYTAHKYDWHVAKLTKQQYASFFAQMSLEQMKSKMRETLTPQNIFYMFHQVQDLQEFKAESGE